MRNCVLSLRFIASEIVKGASKHAVLLGGERTDCRHFTPWTIRTFAPRGILFFSISRDDKSAARNAGLKVPRESERGGVGGELMIRYYAQCREAFNKRRGGKKSFLPHIPGSSKQL